jgi:FkbM family methyltransferase
MGMLINKYNYFIYRLANFLYPIEVHKTAYQIQKIGNDYSFCMVPEKSLSEASIVYSFGAGEDIHSDIGLVRSYGCNVAIFDPTPKAIKHFEELIDLTLQGKQYHCESGLTYDVSAAEIQKIRYEDLALWKEDSSLKFFLPQDPNHVSCSINNIQNTDQYVEVEAKKLSSILKKMGHSHIDYLKLDIEGAEFEVLENIVEEGIDVRAIYLEYHYNDANKPLRNIKRINKSLNMLLLSGYQVIHNDRNRYYTLIKTSP